MCSNFIWILLFPILVIASDSIDWVFMSQRNFNSAQQKGLGDAGAAMTGDVGVGRLNPALLFSSVKNAQGVMSFGYGRDSLFNRHIVPVGFGYAGSDGALGAWYRYQRGENGTKQNELVINFSGLLFKQVDTQGPVDFGVNFRYEWMERSKQEKIQSPVERYVIDSADVAVFQSTIDSQKVVFLSDLNERRFIVDIGFYQPNVLKNVDFGVAMHNVAGYRWKTERPTRVEVDSVLRDSVKDDDTSQIIQRRYEYSDKEHSKSTALGERYRTLIFAAAYRINTGSLQLTLPMDLEILGIFDKNIENRFVFRGGISVLLGDVFIVRAGYARQPKTILEGLTSFKNVNFFTGGVGVAITPFVIDAYFADGAFGMTVEYRY